jgi:serpin B
MRSPTVATRGAEGEGWRAAELPYAGGEVAMVVVVPDDLTSFEATFDGETFATIVDALTEGDVAVRMPRFSARSRFSLRETLQRMGMVRAFGDADLSRLSPADGLYVSDVVHEGFVKVDEEGTEAAAATAVIVDRVSIPFEVALVRPFLFFVRDVETGAVLFVGRVVDPSLGPSE